MSTLLATAAAAKTTLTIKGHDYAAEPIDPVESGSAAFRLVKASGETYDVIRDHAQMVVCDCPSYVTRFAGTKGTCKHGTALIAAGLLRAPSPVPNAPASTSTSTRFRIGQPAPAPVTRQDRARASYFGLKLPAEATPAPVVTPTAPVVPEGWGVIEPEPAPAPAPAPVVIDDTPTVEIRPADVRLAEDAVLFLTESALDLIDDGDMEGAYAIGTTLDLENAELVASFFRVAVEAEGTTWSSWLTSCLTGMPSRGVVPELALTIVESPAIDEEGPRPELVPTGPSEEMDAHRLGYELVGLGENPRAPEGKSFPWLVAFYEGVIEAEGDRATEAWIASVQADRREEAMLAHAFRDEEFCPALGYDF